MSVPDLLQRLALRAAQIPAGSPDRALLLEAARALSPLAAAVPRSAWCEGPMLDAGELDRPAAMPPAPRKAAG